MGDTYCGSGTLTMGHPWSPMVTHGKYGSPLVRYGSPRVRYGPKWSKMVENMSYTFFYKKMFKNRIPHKKIRRIRLARLKIKIHTLKIIYLKVVKSNFLRSPVQFSDF